MLMQLMFLATRTRPDILSAVCALATKCKEPHAADEVRLHRVIGYLAEYKDLELHSLGKLVTHDVLKTTHLTKTAPTVQQCFVKRRLFFLPSTVSYVRKPSKFEENFFTWKC